LDIEKAKMNTRLLHIAMHNNKAVVISNNKAFTQKYKNLKQFTAVKIKILCCRHFGKYYSNTQL
jgi:homoserine dehydrogenase